MHWSGNLLIYLCLIAWGASVPLLAKLMQIRNTWTAQITTVTEQNEKLAADIKAKQIERKKIIDSIDVTTRGWGQVWDQQEVFNFTAGSGQLDVGVGIEAGLGAPDPTKRPITVHVFAPEADSEGFVYVGPFDVSQPGPRDSVLQPTWLVRANDFDGLIPQDRADWKFFRVREYVPSSTKVAFAEMYNELHRSDELLSSRLKTRDLSQKNVERHQANLDAKRRELLGAPDGTPGLQARLAEAESRRNAALARLDDLRRRIDTAYTEQQSLAGEVRQLATRLPGTVAASK